MGPIAFDFDNVLAGPSPSAFGIGDPIPEGVQSVRTLIDSGYRVVIFTRRSVAEMGAIWEWLTRQGLQDIESVYPGKLTFSVLVDDRAITFRRSGWSAQVVLDRLSELGEKKDG